MTFIDAARSLHARLGAIRRDLHAHPELAFAEHRTAALVVRELEELGIEAHQGIGGTGVVGVLRGRPGTRAIGLRADMDALPMTERNEFAHKSTVSGRMHACGHDGHTAMLLGAAMVLAARPDFDGTVHFIFQPAEEGEGGAPAMIADGLFERFPLDAVFGMHNWPGLEAGNFAVHEGSVMASADRFDLHFTGRGAHAAMPHLGRDPVLAGAAFVQAAQGLVSRTISPLEAGVVSISQFHAGEAYNVMPESALLSGTVRAFSSAVRDHLEQGLERIAHGIALAHDLEAEFDYQRGYPATVNDVAAARRCAAAAATVVGADRVSTALPPSMGAEDFSHYLEHCPGAYVWIGNGPQEGGCSLHNPHYDFNDEILPVGVAYWCQLAHEQLSPEAAA